MIIGSILALYAFIDSSSKEAGADKSVLKLKSLEAFAKAADGKATKIIVPSDIAALAGTVQSIAEVAASTKDNSKNK